MWQTKQPAFVNISVIGSSPVTSETMPGASTATGEAVTGVTDGDSMERRASHVPSSKATTMRGVIDRSTMEPVARKVAQGCNLMTQYGHLSLAACCVARMLRPPHGQHYTHFGTSMAHRNPTVRSSKSGSAATRAVTRNADGKSAHDPPRRTRFSPVAGPSGFFTEPF